MSTICTGVRSQGAKDRVDGGKGGEPVEKALREEMER